MLGFNSKVVFVATTLAIFASASPAVASSDASSIKLPFAANLGSVGDYAVAITWMSQATPTGPNTTIVAQSVTQIYEYLVQNHPDYLKRTAAANEKRDLQNKNYPSVGIFCLQVVLWH